MTQSRAATFVKICGITRIEEASAAAAAGADAVGFVFAGGPRNVSIGQAAEIAAHVGSSVRKIGVFVDAGIDAIREHVQAAGLDGVQLHGSEGPGDVRRLKGLFPGLLVFKAIKMDGRDSAGAAADFTTEVDAVMLDSKDVTRPERRSRSLPLDWLSGMPLGKVIVAGGLTPGNVGHLVAALKPWGVDASSGLEIRPGAKDPAKVAEFVHAVRGAEAPGALMPPVSTKRPAASAT